MGCEGKLTPWFYTPQSAQLPPVQARSYKLAGLTGAPRYHILTKTVHIHLLSYVEVDSSAKCSEILAVCVCLRLRKASRLVTRTYDDVLRPVGLRSTQLPILIILSLTHSAPMSVLADQLVMDRTTLSRNLRPLEERELVEIVAGEDKRTREVKLTIQGQEAVAKAIPLWDKAQGYAVEALGKSGRQALHDSLSQLLSLPGAHQ